MISISLLAQLHQKMTERWHAQEVDNPYERNVGEAEAENGALETLVCRQFQYNFLLWHQEDIARSEEVSEKELAQVKRNIDGYNQKRNDWIEKIDDRISETLVQNGVTVSEETPMNTETIGSVIDRLSIMALRIYHLKEQLDRTDVGEEHFQGVRQKIDRCQRQYLDLQEAAQRLVDETFSGRLYHKTYRQMKMYNDPTLNPYLYKGGTKVA
ncbi:MAG: DUF4254 domain-containing protein [Pirellulaceae bacterium]|nr:DUF4254 domain-containing protein [Pirellulaceae bacterium]